MIPDAVKAVDGIRSDQGGPPDCAPPVLLVGALVSIHRGSPSVTRALAERLRGEGWTVQTTSSRSNNLLRALDMLITAWRERSRYEVAHVDVFSGRAFIWAEAVSAVLRRAGRPYLLTLHGGNLPGFSRRWPGRVRRLLDSAESVLAPSDYMLEAMRRFRRDLMLMPNPVDLAQHTFRARPHLSPSLVWVRAFQEMYDPSLAVRVLAAVRERYPEARLTMVGPDKGDGSLGAARELARDLGVADRVRFTGAVPKSEVPRWLEASDIFLNTTTVDNAPVSVLEAMASGLCVVSTDVGGLPYMLRDRENALLVPPRDESRMTAAALELLRDPALSERVSTNARHDAIRHDWQELLPRWKELLIRAASSRKPA